MQDLVAMIRAIVQAELAARPQSGLGRVVAVHTPDAAGQVQYACDVALQGSDAAYEKVPLCTGYPGQLAPPVAGDVVVVQFVAGDPDAPVITGFVFSEAVPAPEIAAGERMVYLPHDGAEADRIEMRQTAGANGSRVWRVTLPEGPELTLTDGAVAAVLDDFRLAIDADAQEATLSAGGASVVLGASGEVRVTADADIAIEASGNLSIKASGNAEIEAGGMMALKAARIDLN